MTTDRQQTERGDIYRFTRRLRQSFMSVELNLTLDEMNSMAGNLKFKNANNF